ncbi:MAG: T9SS type A sorting domain-containing protein [Ignavibacteria bacterium]
MKYIFVVLVMLITMNVSGQWQNASNGLLGGSVCGFTTIGTDIYTAASFFTGPEITDSSGIFRSTNNGLSWTPTAFFPLRIINIFANGSRLFACTNNQGTYYTDNFGASWTSMNLEISSFGSNSTHLFATSNPNLLVSTNNGTNWATINSIYGRLLINGSNVYVYGSNYINISSNNGVNWSTSYLYTYEISLMTALGNELYAVTYSSGIIKSTDNGYTFNQTSQFSSSIIKSLIAFGTCVIAGAWGSGIIISTNGGIYWIRKNEGFDGDDYIITNLLYANGYVLAGRAYYSSGFQSYKVWRRDFQELVSVNEISSALPSKYSLSQNYPNPFNPRTKISFQLSVVSLSTLKVFDITGKEVATLVNERLQPGTYETTFDGSGLNSGVYFYRLTTDGFAETKRMVLIK